MRVRQLTGPLRRPTSEDGCQQEVIDAIVDRLLAAAGDKKQSPAAKLGLTYNRFTAVVARYPFDPDREPALEA